MFSRRPRYRPYEEPDIRGDLDIDSDWVDNPPKSSPPNTNYADQFMMFVFGIFGYFTAFLSIKTVDWMIRNKVSIAVVSVFFIILIGINLWIFRKRFI